MKWEIFRAYDVRGTYPDEINEEACYGIARAYAYQIKPSDVVVGRDVRHSSTSLKNSVVSGLLDAGVNVKDIGQITTDMLYFTVGHYGYSGGIIVSASHNPPQYNGMKLVREGVTAISSDTGLFDIRDTLKKGEEAKLSPSQKGTYEEKEVIQDYVEYLLGFVDTSLIRNFTFVANPNFGFAGQPLKIMADRLKLNVIPLNFDPDGSLPKGPPDPMLEHNRKETEEFTRQSNADFGVAWDGDADRVMFFDENGRSISGVYCTALLAKILIEKYGAKNKIIFDPRVIWPVSKIVESMGGIPIISKGGHSFMKDRMRKENALFGGEMSAHYYFRDNFFADNGMIPLLLIMEYLTKVKKKLSEVITPFMESHYMSGELNYRVKNTDLVRKTVEEQFKKEGEIDYTDGISISSKDWRFNLRSSNTEPLLRLNIEAYKEGLTENIEERIKAIIGEIDPSFQKVH